MQPDHKKPKTEKHATETGRELILKVLVPYLPMSGDFSPQQVNLDHSLYLFSAQNTWNTPSFCQCLTAPTSTCRLPSKWPKKGPALTLLLDLALQNLLSLHLSSCLRA